MSICSLFTHHWCFCKCVRESSNYDFIRNITSHLVLNTITIHILYKLELAITHFILLVNTIIKVQCRTHHIEISENVTHYVHSSSRIAHSIPCIAHSTFSHYLQIISSAVTWQWHMNRNSQFVWHLFYTFSSSFCLFIAYHLYPNISSGLLMTCLLCFTLDAWNNSGNHKA